VRVTSLIFSYLIGLIFLIGGILFIVFLDDNRYLFGITYIVVGLVLVVGTHMAIRRRMKADGEEIEGQ
jgi:drug/metabolite transporter (DMT)-like permease